MKCTWRRQWFLEYLRVFFSYYRTWTHKLHAKKKKLNKHSSIGFYVLSLLLRTDSLTFCKQVWAEQITNTMHQSLGSLRRISLSLSSNVNAGIPFSNFQRKHSFLSNLLFFLKRKDTKLRYVDWGAAIRTYKRRHKRMIQYSSSNDNDSRCTVLF